MMGLTVSQRISASFALIIAVMFGMSATFYMRADSNHERAADVLSSDLAGMGFAGQMRQDLTLHFYQTLNLLRDAEASAGRSSDALAEKKAQLSAIEASLDKVYTNYLNTITRQEDRDATAEFARTREAYLKNTHLLVEILERGQVAEAAQLRSGQMLPQWRKAQEQVSNIVNLNQHAVEEDMQTIQEISSSNKRLAVGALVLALVLAIICGLLLHRSILRPIQATLAAMKTLGTGDLSSKLSLSRRDEFAAIEAGFNGMVTSLRELVVQAQRSSVQLTTSITEIAATNKQQQATTSNHNGNRCDHQRNWRNFAADCRDFSGAGTHHG